MKKINVMIVDDSPFQIALLSDVLTEHGFNVVGQASSLEEVKSEVAKLKPDVVTMDMTIPGTDGFECTDAIHEFDSNISVIIVSSMMDEEIVMQAKKHKVCGYVQKPVDGDELALLINRTADDEEAYLKLKGMYKDVFKESVLNLFNRLTKTIPEIKNESTDNNGRESKGISIVMGIIGKYAGRMILDMPFETGKKLADHMLRREAKNNEEVLNVIAEMANMLAGNACSMINKTNKVYGLRVAPPTTIHGEDIHISKGEIETSYFAGIDSDFGEMSITIGFRKGEGEWM